MISNGLLIRLNAKKAQSSGRSHGGSRGTSQGGSMAQSRSASQESLRLTTKKTPALHLLPDEEEEEATEENASKVRKEDGLSKLRLRHEEELSHLHAQIKEELNTCQLQFEAQLAEMVEQHDSAMSNLVSGQERDVQELRRIQEKDIMMEESMHDSEMKMLIERRILNSVLETVADGIINITPVGVIVRFNSAAEAMFGTSCLIVGYKAEEVIGTNITNLMPNRYAENHHTYLNNYLTTGIKKVIGTGRRVSGLKKDGTEFPLHLSISELKDDDEHLFTGIARDLTAEVKISNNYRLKKKIGTWKAMHKRKKN